MPIPKAARLIVNIVGILIGAAVTLFLVCLAINAFDQELTPTARALLASPSNPYSPESNIYVAMAGFTAPSQQSVVDAGKARIDEYNRNLDAMLEDPDAAAEFSQRSDANKLKFRGDLKSWAPLTSSIWLAAKGHEDRVTGLRNDNQELYERYIALHRLHVYFETARPAAMVPIVFVPVPVRALFLADVATRIQSGTRQQQRAALGELEEDFLLWKAVLDGEGMLLSKMLAVAAIHGDLLLLGDFETDPKSDLTLLEQSALVTPFQLTDWRIGNAFSAEMRFIDSTLRVVPLANSPVPGSSARPASWWARFGNVVEVQFFKLHATENLEADNMEHLQALAEANPVEFSKASGAYRTWLKSKVTIATPSSIYNPVGKILSSIANGNAYEDYIRRVYDVAAMQRLVCLAYEIRQQSIPPRDVPKFMDQHPESATHPIDGEQFHWDSATGSLTVTTKGKQPTERRFGLTLPVN